MMKSEESEKPTEAWEGEFDPLADPEERRVLFTALDSFRQYRRTAHLNTTHRRRQAFYALPSAHWQMLSEPPFSILDNLSRVDDAIDTNADIADAILTIGLASFGLPADPSPDDLKQYWHNTATPSDVNKAHSTIRQFFRDWSSEGGWEREVCYKPVLLALRSEFGRRNQEGEPIKVLVPGAGLGRLVFELCRDGFDTEGNEISYHQLLAGNWILNHAAGPKRHALYPFALHFSNLHKREQQLRQVMIPDEHPNKTIMDHLSNPNPEGRFGTMSMSAADFAVSYRSESNQEAFHAVATVFFIDTAPNLTRYIETIYNCLKPNGIWINVGPLLWHFDEGRGAHGEPQPQPQSQSQQWKQKEDPYAEGIAEPGSVELTGEEVLCLVERMGFTLEKRPHEDGKDALQCGYIQDQESMLQNQYHPVHWIARKKGQ